LVGQEDGVGIVRLLDNTLVRAMLSDTVPLAALPVTVAVRPERILLRAYDDTLQDLPAGMNSVTGQIRQIYYIGTDMRYVVQVGDKTELTVRVQNTEYQRMLTFKDRQMVKVLWDKRNARILTE
jgi:hypothetical protein